MKMQLGQWEALLGGVVKGLFGSGGSGGAAAPAGPQNQNINTVTVNPNFQTQISPNISPVFQQSYGATDSPQSAGTSQNIPTDMVGPYQPVSVTVPSAITSQPAQSAATQSAAYYPYQNQNQNALVYPSGDAYSGYYAQTTPAQTNSLDKMMPWILGGLGVLVLVKTMRK